MINLKQIYRDTYILSGILNGKVYFSVPGATLDDIKEDLVSKGFSVRGKFKFGEPKVKKIIVGWTEGNDDERMPIWEETLTSLFQTVEFHKGATVLNVMKFRYYSPFSGLLEDDEYLYYIDDADLNAEATVTYLISDKDRLFKINMNTNKITELKIEVEKDRVEIKKHKYKMTYLKNHKINRYKF